MVSSLAAALVAVSTLAASAAISSGPGAPQWESDYGKALAASRQEDRPLLVVLDVPGRPESALEAAQLETTGEQGKLLGAYELCHVDASTKHGKKVAEAFKATEFPFTAIIDRTGSWVLTKKTGPISTAEWLDTLAKYKTGEQVETKTVSTSFYRGEGATDTSISSPTGGCKACQLRLQQQAEAQSGN